jgi:four helix bundle protein
MRCMASPMRCTGFARCGAWLRRCGARASPGRCRVACQRLRTGWLARAGFILSVSSLPSRPSRLRRCSLRSQPRPQLRALLLGWLWLASTRDRNHERSLTMKFQAEELSLELVDALAPLMSRIKSRDRALEDQLRRAASSIGLNCAEAAFSDPGNRRARLFTAAGSAGETRHALRQAVAWRHVTAGDAEPALRLVERIVAILWRMTR